MLAAYIWNEESTRIEEENGGGQQRERRTKQTGTEQTEIEEEMDLEGTRGREGDTNNMGNQASKYKHGEGNTGGYGL